MDLATLEEIKRLKYKYLRCLDLKRWDEIAECFVEDATAAYSDGKYSYQGRDKIVAFLRDAMGADTFHSCHNVHHPEIDLTGENTARGTWALQDLVIDTKWSITLRGAAFYEDEYVKTSEGWKLKHTGYRRIFEEVQPRADVPGLRLTASMWGAAD